MPTALELTCLSLTRPRVPSSYLRPRTALALLTELKQEEGALEDPGKIPEKWKPIFLYDVATAAKCELWEVSCSKTKFPQHTSWTELQKGKERHRVQAR